MAQIGLEGGLLMNLLASRKKLLGNTGDFWWSYGGYLIVSTLCDLCGVVLDESNARYFVSDCIESLHDILKSNLNISGVNYTLSLNDNLISKFIEFYKEKEGTLININPSEAINGFYELPFSASSTSEDPIVLASINFINSEGATVSFPVYYSNGTFTKQNLQVYSNRDVTLNICTQFKPSYGNLYDLYASTTTNHNTDYMFSSPAINTGNYILKIPESAVDSFKSFVGTTYPSTLGDVSNLEEYKAKYEKEPSRIILNSSIVNVKTKWKKESTDIYIPDGNIENLPNGVSVEFKIQYLFKEGDQCTNFTGGWQDYYNTGAKIASTIYLSQNEIKNMYAGTINFIDFSKYNRMYIDLESTDRVYIYTATQQGGYKYNPVYEGTDRKIVSFDLQEFPTFRQTKKLYCMIYSVCTAKIYNIWLE